MLKDRYDLALTTASTAAREAYVQATALALTFYPGAIEAYDRAIAADPGFALAHAGKAQVLMRQGEVVAARAALAAAKALASDVSEREASHIAFFDLVFAGQSEAAIFPGQLPLDPAAVFAGETMGPIVGQTDLRFLRLRPPIVAAGQAAPHIRLDRALQFLIGDRLA